MALFGKDKSERWHLGKRWSERQAQRQESRLARVSARQDSRTARTTARSDVRASKVQAKSEAGYWSPEAVASRSEMIGSLGESASQAIQAFGEGGPGLSLVPDLPPSEESPSDDPPWLLIGGALAIGAVLFFATKKK